MAKGDFKAGYAQKMEMSNNNNNNEFLNRMALQYMRTVIKGVNTSDAHCSLRKVTANYIDILWM